MSTTTTPVAVMKTAVLPPPPAPLRTNRLSLSFSTSTTCGACACCAATRSARDSHQDAEHDDPSHDMPPGKKTRWTNQNAPAATTTIDPATTSRRPAASLRRTQRRERRRDDDHDQQLADLHAEVEREQRPAQRPRRQIHLAQDVGEAETVDEAERERDPGAHVPSAVDQQVVRADVDDAEGDRRLDDPRRRA